MTPLKKARLCMHLSQAEVAKLMGINQSTYQRWETCSSKIPEGKIGKLAKVLETSENSLNGKSTEDFFFRRKSDGEMSANYFGELAIHFKSGTSLMFPVSVRERDNFAENYLGSNPFIPVIGMNNRSYLISRESILDVYLSDDSADAFGPEEYVQDGIQWVSDDVWGLIEALEPGLEYWEAPEGFDPMQLADTLVMMGYKPETMAGYFPQGFDFTKVQRTESLDSDTIDKITKCATTIEWQLANGKLRSEQYTEEALGGFKTFIELGGDFEESSIYLSFEENAFSVMSNSSSLNYLSCPTHAYVLAALKEIEEEIDG